MSLFEGKQVVDTLDVLLVYTDPKTKEKTTVATASTTSVDLSRKFDKIEVYNGIHNNKKFSLHTKPNTMLKVKIAEFDTEFLAKKFGSTLDTTSKKTFKKDIEFAVTTAKATVPKATRILSVKDSDGNALTIIPTGTPKEGQCVIKTSTTPGDVEIDLVTGYTGKTIFVTYETEIATGLENARMKISALPELQNCEILCNGIMYDEATNEISHNIFMDFYRCSINPDTELNFQAGKALEMDVEFDVKVTNTLPDGTYVPKAEVGEMIFSEAE